MHTKFLKYYHFINKYDLNHLENLDNNIHVIYRNYNHIIDISEILKIKSICRRKGNKFYISNNFKLCIKLNLDGVYIPSFNKDTNFNCFSIKKNFKIIGSAHNRYEINFKLRQNVKEIFISSIFKRNSNYLGIYNFLSLKKFNTAKTIALGGINSTNLKKVCSTGAFGISGIEYIKKKAP